jgi:D-alanyl-D-alanine dipeptidase
MGRHTGVLLAMTFCLWGVAARADPLPDGFVYLSDLAPGIRQDMRYAGSNNFIGRPITGYHAGRCILSRPAATALAAVEQELEPQGLALKVFDCYRPQQAVDDFVNWGHDLTDQKNKAVYYPLVPKQQLFLRGYIAEKSGHSRGSTMDLTVVMLVPGKSPAVQGPALANGEVDMGSPFDLFDEHSHTDFSPLPAAAARNRQWFRTLMDSHGFKNLPEEWWHYTLRDEPFPAQYFNFPVQ